MSLATARAALAAMVAAVPSVGQVHDYARYARLESDFQNLYLYTPPDGGVPHLRGWQLSNTGIEEFELGIGRVLNKHKWTLRGYCSLNDAMASEKVFDDVGEAIRSAFRADPTLGGVCSAEALGNGPAGMQKTDAGPVMFCGVLCNSIVLQCETWEYI